MLRKTHVAMLVAAVVVIAVVLAALSGRSEGTAQAARQAELAPLPEVSFLTAAPAEHREPILAHGEALARFDITVAAEVTGRVTAIGATLEPGGELNAGDILLNIDDTEYRQAVSLAQQAIADARVRLLEETQRGVQAEREWEAAGLGDEPLSDLVLRKPQQQLARAAEQSARDQLAAAELNLQRTQVSAPFDSIVVERLVAPGSYVSPGTPLARLVSRDRVEIRVPLSDRQWRVAATETGTDVIVRSPDGAATWAGRVLRTEGHVDRENRQRAVVIAVDNPVEQHPPLHPGRFVSVEIPGAVFDVTYRLPPSALSTDGEIWYVDDDDRLNSFRPSSIHNFNDVILVVAPDGNGKRRILLRPLAAYDIGQHVRPVESEQ